MHDRVSKEMKLLYAKDIVASLAKSDKDLSADDLCDYLKKVYATIDELAPEPKDHRVGLA